MQVPAIIHASSVASASISLSFADTVMQQRNIRFVRYVRLTEHSLSDYNVMARYTACQDSAYPEEMIGISLLSVSAFDKLLVASSAAFKKSIPGRRVSAKHKESKSP